ncbi:TIGR00645 family protein [Sphingomonas sp. So64.6b]|uniref:TIGR00645 family protein n=1 Tax=Sphingomonas sp. So64.6b TaxID=2997354 RepID=UPI0016015DF1|nr:TIGR00645 family protein [Sphingomonas sp. So64.6b]QNA84968.1 TIGR00645 family protein [Sphingomonas sp. So64.6b]
MLANLERWFENGLFASRWLLAPFYVGLVVAVLILLGVFARELVYSVPHMMGLSVEAAILKVLSLLDLVLAANLVVIVILAGYENFVSKIDTAGHEDRPGWMGTTSFAGLKLKLYASIVAISGIQLLKTFMGITSKPVDGESLMWMTIIHFAFVITAVLSALTDFLSARSKGAVG